MKPEEQVRPQSIQSVGAPKDTVRDQDKIMLVLAYLGLLALIPMLTVKDSEFVKWHSKQGLVLTVGGFIAASILAFIPVLGQIAYCAMALGIIVLGIMGIVKGLNGERWRIPLVADLADKF